MKPSILLINIPSMPFDNILKKISNKSKMAHRLEMPLGILYLSSYIKKHNAVTCVRILDYALYLDNIHKYNNIENFILSGVKESVDFIPNILAFSVLFSTSHSFFVKSLNLLKSIWPEAVTVAGGHHATNTAKTLLKMENLDYVIRGEAEKSFSELVESISQAKPVNIKGVYSRANIGFVSSLEVCEYIDDLDDLPFPDWNLLNIEAYLNSKGRKRNIGASSNSRCATLITTRGCPFKCTFCSSHTVHGRKVRFRSVKNVIEEIKLLHDRYGVTLFIPEDDLFTIDQERVVSLLSAIKDLKISNFEMQFPNALSVNTINKKIIDVLIETGMKVACLAIESGSEYVQKHIIKKYCDLKKAKELVGYLKSKDIIVRCYYVLGFPDETKEYLTKTVEYAKSLNSDWSVFSIATPLVGSEMYEQFIDMGCIYDDADSWSNFSYHERHFDTEKITAEELNEFVYGANLEVNFINNPNIINGNFNKAIDILTDIVIHYPFHIMGWYCIMRCYKGLGNEKKVKELSDKIDKLIKSDFRSAEMFSKYGYLMKEFEKVNL